jgi:hypothetical protein
MLVLAAIVLIGAAVLAWLDRWRKSGDSAPATVEEQLAEFQESYERGELTQKEFERIRARLSQRLGTLEQPPSPGTDEQKRPESPQG